MNKQPSPQEIYPAYYRNSFKKIGVLGDGVMGSQIAVHLTNCRIPTILYCTITIDEKAKPEYIRNLKKRILALKPPALALPAWIDEIEIAFLDDAQGKKSLGECDLLIEAIIEQIDEKKKLYQSIASSVNKNAIIASNTSGLSIQSLAQVLPKEFASRFCGIHFFNPVRYLALCELIPLATVPPQQIQTLRGFLSSVLGKHVVISKDSPAFIGNRLGLFCVLATFSLAEKHKLPPDLVDELTGSFIKHASSATFRTADVVGLDVLAFVAENMEKNLTSDPWHAYFSLPAWIKKLLLEKKLGAKTGQGIYHKRGKDIYVFDPSLNDYRLTAKKLDPELKKLVRSSEQGIVSALVELKKINNAQSAFLWDLHRELFLYASYHLDSFAQSVREADIAITSGFGWEIGIFELWQAAGIDKINQLILNDCSNKNQLSTVSLPTWVQSGQPFYTTEGALSPSQSKRISLLESGIGARTIRSARVVAEQGNADKVFFENDGIIAHEINSSLIAIAHKTKLNVLSYDVIKGYHTVLDQLESRDAAIVIHQLKPHFGAGANLAEMIVAAKIGKIRSSGMLSSLKSKAAVMLDDRLPDISNMPPVSEVIPLLQNLCMRLKHGRNPVVACVEGLTLGGCCEIILHTTRNVAALNSYIGLVEIGVGLLPAGGGTKEMAFRASLKTSGAPTMFFHQQHVEQILMGKVSENAYQARNFNYLRQEDIIIANPDELFHTGCKVALSLLETDYRPEPRNTAFEVLGMDGYATILSQLENMHYGKFISDYDRHCATTIAHVYCGGGVDTHEKVTSDWMLLKERDAFLELLEQEKTQERIEYMLKNNKPLRN